jgi:hypothetical protein
VRHILHLVKDPEHRTAFDVIDQQARDPEVRVSVVLMQAAAGVSRALPNATFRLAETADRRDGSPHAAITHSQLLDLIFSADTVVTW